jgi:hypothetical protein
MKYSAGSVVLTEVYDDTACRDSKYVVAVQASPCSQFSKSFFSGDSSRDSGTLHFPNHVWAYKFIGVHAVCVEFQVQQHEV